MKLMTEVVEEPSDMRKSGTGALISHVMRITSTRLHSKTETLMPLLVDDSSFQIGDQSVEGLYFLCMLLYCSSFWQYLPQKIF